MSRVVLDIENVSKQYRLGLVGTGTLSHDLNRWYHRVRGKEDPYQRVGVENDRSVAGGDYVWALRDINLQVNDGDVLGIIGKNGAGKSTLLKLLSRITTPTTGEIRIKGRIAALLEVGTGFHPELTGRENIFLNGAILGMTKKEIKSKLDEIVDFSGVAKYIDTPIKRYSSGMKVRLGFAVAAFLEPEILVVDEVLAVGDAAFQKQCIGRMKEVSKQGRTVLFVSHNMLSIQSLCERVIWMHNGGVQMDGEAEPVINNYLKHFQQTEKSKKWDLSDAPGKNDLRLLKVEVRNPNDEMINLTDPIHIDIDFWNQLTPPPNIAVRLYNHQEIPILTSNINDSSKQNTEFRKNENACRCIIPPNLLNTGEYLLEIIFFHDGGPYFKFREGIVFEVRDNRRKMGYFGRRKGVVAPVLDWELR